MAQGEGKILGDTDEILKKMEAEIITARKEYDKFSQKGVKACAPRIRLAMKNIKDYAISIRFSVVEDKKGI